MLPIVSSLYHEGSNLTDLNALLSGDASQMHGSETQENILQLASNDYVEHHVDRVWLSGMRILAKRVLKIVGDCHRSPLQYDLTELSTRVYLGEEVGVNCRKTIAILGVKRQLGCQFGLLTPALVPVLVFYARKESQGGQNPTASAVLSQPLNQIFAQCATAAGRRLLRLTLEDLTATPILKSQGTEQNRCSTSSYLRPCLSYLSSPSRCYFRRLRLLLCQIEWLPRIHHQKHHLRKNKDQFLMHQLEPKKTIIEQKSILHGVPAAVRHQFHQSIEDLKSKKRKGQEQYAESYNVCDEVEREFDEIKRNEIQQQQKSGVPAPSSRKEKQVKGLQSYFPLATTPRAQPTINSVLQSKEIVEKCDIVIAKWMIDASISFNAVNSPYY
ncbi:hypothetical protein AHAS_Ahas07G0120600 [Arachis hypogaea]